MSITNSLRLVLAVLGVAGLTVLSIILLCDLQGAPSGPGTNAAEEAALGPVLGYGLVDVESGVRRLAPGFPGRVKEILVRENEEVKAGKVLLRLEDESLRLRLRQARAEFEDAEKQMEEAGYEPQRHRARLEQQKQAVRAARNKADVARRQLDRRRDWLKSFKDISTERDVLDAQDLVQTLEAAVYSEQARLEELQLHDPSLPEARARKVMEARQAQLELAEHELSRSELRATERGKVLRILVGPGDFVPGTAGQPAIEFCPDRPRIVRAEVSQEWAARLSPGQKVLLQDDEMAELHWIGEVRQVSDWLTLRRSVWPGPQEIHDQRTAECIIEPKSGPPHLRIGQKIRVLLASGKR